MKTMIKIALAFSLVIGLSFSAHAAEVKTSTGGAAITIPGATVGKDLSFTPSGNTLLAANSAQFTYVIAAASSKTNSDNGMQYGMVNSSNGYYQTTGGGSAPDSTKVTDWTAMGGGSGS